MTVGYTRGWRSREDVERTRATPDDRRCPTTLKLCLLALKGEAGSGKSTLGRALGRRLQWPVVDKDDIRDLLDDTQPGLAYDVMFNVARRQLLQGLSVICDSPLTNPGPAHAAQIAREAGATLAIVECHCPDEAVWRDRINNRKALHLPSHHQTDWDTMQAHRLSRPTRAPGSEIGPHPYLVVNTLVPVDTLCEQVLAWLATQGIGG
jgi:predicted kinase